MKMIMANIPDAPEDDATSMAPVLIPNLHHLALEFVARSTSVTNTRKAYLGDLKRLLEFTRGNISNMSLLMFKERLFTQYKARSAARTLTVCRQFLDFLVMRGLIPQNYYGHIKGPRVDKSDSPYIALSDEQVRSMIDHPGNNPHQRMALVLGFYLGLRVSEIVGLRCLDLVNGILRVKGKGGKVRVMPLPDLLLSELETYLSQVPMGQYVIRSERALDGATPLSSRTIERWFSAIASACGISERVTPHSARATLITKALDEGASIRDVAIMAGHTSIETTSIYDKKRGESTLKVIGKINY